MHVTAQKDGREDAIAELIDRSRITDLIYRLGAALDEKRAADLPSIFVQDIQFNFADHAVSGIDAVIEQAGRISGEFHAIQHLFANILIDLEGDEAKVRANLIGTHVFAHDDTGRHWDVGFVFRFRVVRRVEGWRIAEAAIQPIWSNGTRNGTIV